MKGKIYMVVSFIVITFPFFILTLVLGHIFPEHPHLVALGMVLVVIISAIMFGRYQKKHPLRLIRAKMRRRKKQLSRSH